MTDRATASAQIGRPVRSDVTVNVRCSLALPIVITVPPVLDDGTPFPTMYWLTCPLAQIRVARLESAGGVRAMDRRAETDGGFAKRLASTHERYAAERDRHVPPDAEHTPRGGVAGSEQGVKCLHAHLADTLAGNDNPVGELVDPWVEPLECSVPCVVDGARNPDWVEPK